MHSALEHLNTVDNKKCKYAMHIVMSSSFQQTSRSDIETQINPQTHNYKGFEVNTVVVVSL